MEKYVVLDKQVGVTPLQCMEDWRAAQPPSYQDVPLTYAGRLDPLASGKLLILIGKECKRKEQYLKLDKAYTFTVLLGTASDSGDVLGLLSTEGTTCLKEKDLNAAAKTLTGSISLPYPVFSSKTVAGKPLHTWVMEGRLGEITIPTKHSTIHRLALTELTTLNAKAVHQAVQQKIATVPPVTELRKALGNDFRREEVLAGWDTWLGEHIDQTWQIATFTCVASSGTYMRTVANEIATQCGTRGLAWFINRTRIGRYQTIPGLPWGFWRKQYR